MERRGLSALKSEEQPVSVRGAVAESVTLPLSPPVALEPAPHSARPAPGESGTMRLGGALRGASGERRIEPWYAPPLLQHAELLLRSYARLLGRELILPGPLAARARALFEGPMAVLSHDTGFDARFTYANRTALTLWQAEWPELVGQSSRYSAQYTEREERDRLLGDVRRDGFATGYSGLRATRSGRRFRIQDVTIWNLVDERGVYQGQAASFARWTFL
jgi:hypothetical protein